MVNLKTVIKMKKITHKIMIVIKNIKKRKKRKTY